MPNKAAAAYLYPAVLTYSALVFGGWTVRGFLVLEAKRREICGEDDEGDNETCDEDEVSRQAALFLTWVGIASSLPPIFMAGPLGRLADSAGRRYPAMLVVSGELVLSAVCGASSALGFPISWTLPAFIVQGLTGSFTIFFMSTSSYIADINARDAAKLTGTAKVERFSFVEASLTVGIILGPLGAGLALDSFGFVKVYVVFSFLLLTLVAYLAFVVPESLIKDNRNAVTIASASTLEAMRLVLATRPYSNAVNTIGKQEASIDSLNKSLIDYRAAPEPAIKLSHVSLAFVLLFGSNTSVQQLLLLYSTREWNWGPTILGVYAACIGVVGTASLLFMRRVYRCLTSSDMKDTTFMVEGAAAAALFNILFAIFNTPIAAFSMLPLLSFQLGALPSYRHMYSICYPAERQAEVLLHSASWKAYP